MAKKEPVGMTNLPHDSDSTPLRVRRGRVGSVDLYEVKDSELDILENGSPTDIQLNFAIFLLSVAFSSIASLVTATFVNRTVEIIFIVVAVAGILLGAYLLILWHKTRISIKSVTTKIRDRMPKEPTVCETPGNSLAESPKKPNEPAG